MGKLTELVIEHLLSWFGQQDPSHQRKILARILVSLLVLVAVSPMVYHGLLALGWLAAFPMPAWGLAFCVFAVELVVGSVLYFVLKGTLGEAQSQHGPQDSMEADVGTDEQSWHCGESFYVTGKSGEAIQVKRLSRKDGRSEDRLYLTWDIFIKGTEYLLKQMKDSGRYTPDLCIGVNRDGMIIAALISKELSDGKKILGYVHTLLGTHVVGDVSLPDVKPKQILIVDDELKKGNSAKNVIDHLRNLYNSEPDLKFAVLVACKVAEDIASIRELSTKGIFEVSPEYLPDFLAFVSENKVALKKFA